MARTAAPPSSRSTRSTARVPLSNTVPAPPSPSGSSGSHQAHHDDEKQHVQNGLGDSVDPSIADQPDESRQSQSVEPAEPKHNQDPTSMILEGWFHKDEQLMKAGQQALENIRSVPLPPLLPGTAHPTSLALLILSLPLSDASPFETISTNFLHSICPLRPMSMDASMDPSVNQKAGVESALVRGRREKAWREEVLSDWLDVLLDICTQSAIHRPDDTTMEGEDLIQTFFSTALLDPPPSSGQYAKAEGIFRSTAERKTMGGIWEDNVADRVDILINHPDELGDKFPLDALNSRLETFLQNSIYKPFLTRPVDKFNFNETQPSAPILTGTPSPSYQGRALSRDETFIFGQNGENQSEEDSIMMEHSKNRPSSTRSTQFDREDADEEGEQDQQEGELGRTEEENNLLSDRLVLVSEEKLSEFSSDLNGQDTQRKDGWDAEDKEGAVAREILENVAFILAGQRDGSLLQSQIPSYQQIPGRSPTVDHAYPQSQTQPEPSSSSSQVKVKKPRKRTTRASMEGETEGYVNPDSSEGQGQARKGRGYTYFTGRNQTGRIRWTAEEDECLLNEMKEYKEEKTLPWASIIHRHGPNGSVSQILSNRNAVALKDRARNIKTRMKRLGESVPESLEAIKIPAKRDRTPSSTDPSANPSRRHHSQPLSQSQSVDHPSDAPSGSYVHPENDISIAMIPPDGDGNGVGRTMKSGEKKDDDEDRERREDYNPFDHPVEMTDQLDHQQHRREVEDEAGVGEREDMDVDMTSGVERCDPVGGLLIDEQEVGAALIDISSGGARI
ncbi:SANT/Myb domain [Phaffia rhodozyma]|uniref:SANT/Myb domain n=1 Tax=Phaffia rhodozyma TaxID=264483 RepID=A0A0F7SMY0_PHARH|nr:SANT/Myb domain [Phaffia rhodozyma]